MQRGEAGRDLVFLALHPGDSAAWMFGLGYTTFGNVTGCLGLHSVLPVCVSFSLTAAPMSPAPRVVHRFAVLAVQQVNLADALGRPCGRY